MNTQTPTPLPPTARDAFAGEAASRPSEFLARVRQIESATSSMRERATMLLEVLRAGLGGVGGAMTVALDREEMDRLTESGPEGIAEWHGHLRAAALDARSHARSLGQVFGADPQHPDLVLVAAPIEVGGSDPFGGVAILCPWRGRDDAERLRLHLRAALLVGSEALRSRSAPTALRVDDFARVLARSGQYRSVTEFAYAITNAVKQRFGCEQVCLGLLQGEALKVACISGLDHVNRRSPGVHRIEQAMCECLDAGVEIVEQDHEQWSEATAQRGGLLHERWRAATGGGCIVSIPLAAGDRPVGVLSMRRLATDPFKPEELESLRTLLIPLASAVPLVERSTRTLPSHAKATIHNGAAWVVRPGSTSRKVAMAVGLLLALWFVFKPTTYRVSAAATVVVESEVMVASPIDAAVSEVLVRAGDRVAEGQPLLHLDTSALRVRREHLQSEVQRASIRLTEAVSLGDPAAAAIARAERDIHLAGVAHADTQIARSTLLAPAAGIILGSQISNLRGRLVPIGEPLLSIAVEDSLALEIDVPERRVTDLAAGAGVRFASHARPEDAARLVLESIEPAATIREGKPVFVAHAEVPHDQSWLRPGMEGVAMIDAGRKPNWWIGVHHVIDFAHLHFWID